MNTYNKIFIGQTNAIRIWKTKNYPEIFDKTVKIVGDTHLGFDRFYNIVKPYEFKITWKEQHENETCPFELSKDK